MDTTPSEFTVWLRENGYSDLCPPDDKPRPLTSRTAELASRGGTEVQIRKLMTLWRQWRLGGNK